MVKFSPAKEEFLTLLGVYELFGLHSIGEAEREAMAVYEDACENKNPLTDSLTEKEKGLR